MTLALLLASSVTLSDKKNRIYVHIYLEKECEENGFKIGCNKSKEEDRTCCGGQGQQTPNSNRRLPPRQNSSMKKKLKIHVIYW